MLHCRCADILNSPDNSFATNCMLSSVPNQSTKQRLDHSMYIGYSEKPQSLLDMTDAEGGDRETSGTMTEALWPAPPGTC